jgi:hypothetical protein
VALLILIYMILAQDSGMFVLSVADNVTKFTNAVPKPSLIGMGLILALVYLITNRPCGPSSRGAQADAPAFTVTPFSLSVCCNSPAWNISRTMSQPPTNSPFT